MDGPTTITVARGRELLTSKGLRHMEGSNNTRGEFWIWPDGRPEFVPYFGPPYGDYFVERSIREIVTQP